MNAFLAAIEVLLLTNLAPPTVVQGQSPSNNTCEMEGKFEIDDGTCSNYYICVWNGNAFVGYEFQCSTSALFDPSLETCVPATDFACTQITTTTQPPCVMSGRFEITDPNCQKYYFCFWDGTAFTRWDLKCPNPLLFNPNVQRCVLPTSYVCPT